MKYTKNASPERKRVEYPRSKKTNEGTNEGVDDNKIFEVVMEINRLKDFSYFLKYLEVAPYKST